MGRQFFCTPHVAIRAGGWHAALVPIGRKEKLTKEARFFLEPEKPLHRQYEALRAYFVEQRPSGEVAVEFGYTPGSFRVLCHSFRREKDKEARFFCDVRRGPQSAPSRDRVRELAVAMRKKNLSVRVFLR